MVDSDSSTPVFEYKLPLVSLCTPTFNRRPFIPYIIECVNSQDYPKHLIEWIIIDDGTDKIKDIIDMPNLIHEDITIKYFEYDTKMSLGTKRNLMHEKSSGDIIVYIDDDDFYPKDRVSHAVETLKNNPDAMCAGSSEMYIYFKHISKMIKFGPYGPNHATAATFAFRKELLKDTQYDGSAAVAEEKHFLKDYTIPFVQLDPMKTILVFSHVHNSFDKKTLLEGPANQFINPSDKTPEQFVKDANILNFFMKDIDVLLENYDPGHPKHKPDVLKQIEEIKLKRDKMQQDQNLMLQQLQQNPHFHHIIQQYEQKLSQMNTAIQQVYLENKFLKEKLEYILEKKMT
jgi:glycosyltransferase involved in cell wall biosynthesis